MTDWDYTYLGLLCGEEDAEEYQELLEDIAENSDYEEFFDVFIDGWRDE